MIEAGFSKIPTQIIEKLYSPETKLTNESMKVLHFIIRKTYGWGKESDRISESQFVEALGIKRQNIQRAIKTLESQMVIRVARRDNKKERVFSINIDVNSWGKAISTDCKMQSSQIAKSEEQKDKMQSAQMQDVITTDCKMQSSQRRTIDNIYSTIDTPIYPDSTPGDQGEKNGADKKKNKPKSKPLVTDLHLSIADYLIEKIREFKPDYKPAFSKADRTRWANDTRLMVEIDKRSPERVKEVIDWSMNHHFWRSNILSAGKLREKFDQLELQIESGKSFQKSAKHMKEEKEMTGVDYFNQPQTSIEDLLR